MRFVLSDLDGVLVDSGAAVERVWREWAAEQRLDGDAVARASHGVPARGVLARVAPHLDTAAEAERIDRLHAATGGRALPGAAELLAGAPPGRLAVVTSCSPPLAAARLRAAGLPDPPVLITSHDSERGKPPRPLPRGSRRTGCRPGGLPRHRGRARRHRRRPGRRHDRVGGDDDAPRRGARRRRGRGFRTSPKFVCGLLAVASSCERPDY
jgi:hypothetical protein